MTPWLAHELRGRGQVRFALDSPVEEAGLEPPVPFGNSVAFTGRREGRRPTGWSRKLASPLRGPADPARSWEFDFREYLDIPTIVALLTNQPQNVILPRCSPFTTRRFRTPSLPLASALMSLLELLTTT